MNRYHGGGTPEIVGCACLQDHATMPTEDGFELVCRVHKRHQPCRKCATAEQPPRSGGLA